MISANRRKPKQQPIAILTVILSPLFFNTAAHGASGSLLPRPTTEAIGMADANVALASGPSAQFINPAGLEVATERQEWETSVAIGRADSTFSRPVAQSGAAAGTFEAKPSYPVVPSLAWAYPLTSAVTVGLALDVPFGTSIEWPDHTFDRALGGGMNADIAKRSELRVIRLGPAIAYGVSEHVRIGARVFAQHVYASDENDFSKVEGDGTEAGYQLGVRWQSENIIVGSSYTSRTRTDVKGEQTDIHPAAAGVLIPGSVRANIDLPARWQTGLAWRLHPTLWWETDLDWAGWSAINNLDIVQSNGTLVNAGKNSRSYRNTVSVYSGLRWQKDSQTTWYLGLGHDPAPLNETDVSPTVSVSPKSRVGIGATRLLSKGLKLGTAYQYARGHTRDVSATVQDNTSTGDTHLFEGTYSIRTHILSITLSGQF